METILSADGTTIAYGRTGEGTPLAHESSSSAVRWVCILPALARHATAYAIEREVEDLFAVIGGLCLAPQRGQLSRVAGCVSCTEVAIDHRF